MLKIQKQAKAIKKIQEVRLPNLRQQLAETTGIFKSKERKAPKKQIQQTEAELKEKPDKLPDILTDDGDPDVQAFMKTYRKAEAIVTQYDQDLAEWEQAERSAEAEEEIPRQGQIINQHRRATCLAVLHIYQSIRKHPARFLRLAGCFFRHCLRLKIK